MPRSVWKGPNVHPSIEKKINLLLSNPDVKSSNTIINVFKRGTMIIPTMVGRTFGVHNGRKFIPVAITAEMVGSKLGSFAPTRTYHGHASNKTVKKSK